MKKYLVMLLFIIMAVSFESSHAMADSVFCFKKPILTLEERAMLARRFSVGDGFVVKVSDSLPQCCRAAHKKLGKPFLDLCFDALHVIQKIQEVEVRTLGASVSLDVAFKIYVNRVVKIQKDYAVTVIESYRLYCDLLEQVRKDEVDNFDDAYALYFARLTKIQRAYHLSHLQEAFRLERGGVVAIVEQLKNERSINDFEAFNFYFAHVKKYQVDFSVSATVAYSLYRLDRAIREVSGGTKDVYTICDDDDKEAIIKLHLACSYGCPVDFLEAYKRDHPEHHDLITYLMRSQPDRFA